MIYFDLYFQKILHNAFFIEYKSYKNNPIFHNFNFLFVYILKTGEIDSKFYSVIKSIKKIYIIAFSFKKNF